MREEREERGWVIVGGIGWMGELWARGKGGQMEVVKAKGQTEKICKKTICVCTYTTIRIAKIQHFEGVGFFRLTLIHGINFGGIKLSGRWHFPSDCIIHYYDIIATTMYCQ